VSISLTRAQILHDPNAVDLEIPTGAVSWLLPEGQDTVLEVVEEHRPAINGRQFVAVHISEVGGARGERLAVVDQAVDERALTPNENVSVFSAPVFSDGMARAFRKWCRRGAAPFKRQRCRPP
jgi:hypothetical protein